nr:type II secretion system ATPase GspE [Deltaproteobacteria bacterium]
AAPQDALYSSGWVVAVNEPARFQATDDLIRILGIDDFQIVLSTRAAILSAINTVYDQSRDSAEQLVQDIEEDGGTLISDIEDIKDLLDDTSEAPIIRLVNHIISQSVNARASDIHFEPYKNSFKVRSRIDGILYDLISPPTWVQPVLTSRIKVIAKMNIAEKRLPQDGRFDVRIGDQDIDVRVSTIPTSFGERCVLRLLNKTTVLLKISELGLAAEQLNLIQQLVKSPNGIILVTGPTGSGKTTTLYAVLSAINSPDINIITVEDPVEYQIKGISQIQVNPKIDLTFASGLRSIVRQDPDVILVGEIRDRETAEIAVQSALTGHLVFSTLHTNDAAGAITRLVDIGIEPFLLSSSVNVVVAQRLVRVLCNDCKQSYTPDEMALRTLDDTPAHWEGATVYRPVGCPNCLNTGYKGRIGIFEIMVLEDRLKAHLLKTSDSASIKRQALSLNMVTLRQDGIQKAKDGITSIEEVMRVAQE